MDTNMHYHSLITCINIAARMSCAYFFARMQLIKAEIHLHVCIILVSNIVSMPHVVHFKVPCTSISNIKILVRPNDNKN